MRLPTRKMIEEYLFSYIGHMVQWRTVRISYKSKKCLMQPPESWVVVKNTREPLVDAETFRKVQLPGTLGQSH